MPNIDPQEMAEQAARFFDQAAHDPRLGERLALAQTSVHIHFSDTAGITLLLDRTPIESMPSIVGTAEVELWGSADLFAEIIRRDKQMAMAITDGDLEYRGPVRKFLRIVPILRSFDFSAFRPATPGSNGAAPAADL